MRITFTTLFTAVCLAGMASGLLAADGVSSASQSLRSSFDYSSTPSFQSQIAQAGALSPPVADAGYSFVTDDTAAAVPATNDATLNGAATDCGSTCGCGDSCSSGRCFSFHDLLCSGNCCDLGDAWTLSSCLTPCCECGPTYGGWLEAGYYDNNARLSSDPSDGLALRDYPDHLNLEQAWLYVEKKAEAPDCGCAYGYRFDIMYGVDAQVAQSFGNPRALDGPNRGAWDASFDNGPYGWAMPQAYVEVATGDWSVKLGHFFTPLGYEVLPANGNFFYSHSLSWYNSEPITHTGVLGTYTANDCMTWYAGWTLGFDTGYDQFGGGNNFIGGFTRKMNDNVSFTYLMTVGDLGWRSGGEFGYTHSIVLANELSDCLTWALASDLVDTDGTIADDRFHDHDYGVANYLIYKLNECWSAGGRAEWWSSNNVTGDQTSFQEITGGLNYHSRREPRDSPRNSLRLDQRRRRPEWLQSNLVWRRRRTHILTVPLPAACVLQRAAGSR